MQNKILNLSFDIVFDLCREAIYKSNFRVLYEDRNIGIIFCSTDDFVDTERSILINIRQINLNENEVVVESKYYNTEIYKSYTKVDEKIFLKHLSMIFH